MINTKFLRFLGNSHYKRKSVAVGLRTDGALVIYIYDFDRANERTVRTFKDESDLDAFLARFIVDKRLSIPKLVAEMMS